MGTLTLDPDDHWVACSTHEFGRVGNDCHILRGRGITTACGATASTPEIWQDNSTKPRCKHCVEALVRNDRSDGFSERRRRGTPMPEGRTVFLTNKEVAELAGLLDMVLTNEDQWEFMGLRALARIRKKIM